MKRQSGLIKVGGEPVGGFQQHVLDDITGIHTATYRPIHAVSDQFPQRVPVPVHQPLNRLLIPVSRGGEQFLGAFRIGPEALRVFRHGTGNRLYDRRHPCSATSGGKPVSESGATSSRR